MKGHFQPPPPGAQPGTTWDRGTSRSPGHPGHLVQGPLPHHHHTPSGIPLLPPPLTHQDGVSGCPLCVQTFGANFPPPPAALSPKWDGDTPIPRSHSSQSGVTPSARGQHPTLQKGYLGLGPPRGPDTQPLTTAPAHPPPDPPGPWTKAQLRCLHLAPPPGHRLWPKDHLQRDDRHPRPPSLLLPSTQSRRAGCPTQAVHPRGWAEEGLRSELPRPSCLPGHATDHLLTSPELRTPS